MAVLPELESTEFASALKAVRKQLRLSRTALADQVGLSTAAIQRYEALDASNIKPSRDAYERLCKVVDTLLAQQVELPAANLAAPVAPRPAVIAEDIAPKALPSGILLADATLEQLIARAKMLGARKVTIEF